MTEKHRRLGSVAVLLFTALTFLFLGGLLAVPSSAATPPELENTGCAYLYNISGDKVLYAKNMSTTIYPASTAKIMSAVIFIENWSGDWDTEIEVTQDMLCGVSGITIGLRSGETVTYRDMINCMIIGSANDCAQVLAHTVCGGLDHAVSLMNAKAQELGMYDTHYENITGMHDPDMVTTLNDVVLLTKYAIAQYKYYEVATSYKYDMAATERSGTRRIFTRNYFVTTYYSSKYYRRDVSGINVGSTSEAGFCAVITAEHDGTAYLVIIMGAGQDSERTYSYVSAGKLLDWAYDNFGYVNVIDGSDIVAEVPVGLSATYDKVALYPRESLDVFMEGDIDVDRDIRKTVVLNDDELLAPLSKGDTVGYVTLSYNNEIIGRMELIVRSDIPRSEIMYIGWILSGVLRSPTFIIVAVILLIIGAAYIFIHAADLGREKRRAEEGRLIRGGIRSGKSPEELTYRASHDKRMRSKGERSAEKRKGSISDKRKEERGPDGAKRAEKSDDAPKDASDRTE